jgi:uncharacterized protein DUF669
MAYEEKEQKWYVPEGTYKVKIIKVEESVSKNGMWGMVNVRFQVISPEDEKGNIFHHRFFIHHVTGHKHAIKGLESIRRLAKAALGVETDDYQELFDCKVTVTVKLDPEKAKDNGDGFWPPQNHIVDIRSSSGLLKAVPSMRTSKTQEVDESINDELPF